MARGGTHRDLDKCAICEASPGITPKQTERSFPAWVERGKQQTPRTSKPQNEARLLEEKTILSRFSALADTKESNGVRISFLRINFCLRARLSYNNQQRHRGRGMPIGRHKADRPSDANLWSTTMENINRMPYLTFNMLIDAINPYEILYKPSKAEHKTFKWISSIHWERGTIQERDVIITCKEKAAREAMSLFPESLLIVLIEQNKAGDFFGTELFDDLKTRPAQAIIVSAPQSDNLLQKIQNRFLDLREWQYKLSSIDSLSNSSSADVLAKSSTIAGVPIILYDMGMKFVAKSRFNETSPHLQRVLKAKGGDSK